MTSPASGRYRTTTPVTESRRTGSYSILAELPPGGQPAGRTLPLREAVVRAIGMTGPTVTSAGLILAGTFAVFAAAGGGVMGGQLQSIGLGLALGVLLDTFGVRTLLVPSIVVLLGRWNWGPSRLGRPSSAERGQPAQVPCCPEACPCGQTAQFWLRRRSRREEALRDPDKHARLPRKALHLPARWTV